MMVPDEAQSTPEAGSKCPVSELIVQDFECRFGLTIPYVIWNVVRGRRGRTSTRETQKEEPGLRRQDPFVVTRFLCL
jgi:hypothetical protein